MLRLLVAATVHSIREQFDKYREDTKRLMHDELVKLAPEAVQGQEKYTEGLTPDQDQKAIEAAIERQAQSYIDHPLTAETKDVKDRLRGFIQAERMQYQQAKGIEAWEALEERGKAAGVTAATKYGQFRSRISSAWSPEEIKNALASGEEYIAGLENTAKQEALAEQKMAVEFAESLKPMYTVDSPSIKTAGVWGGNVVEGDSPSVTDGHAVIMREAVKDKKRLASLAARDIARTVRPDAVQQVLDVAIPKATKPLQELGHAESGLTDYALYADEQDQLYAFNPKKVRFIQSLTGATEMRASDPKEAAVFYKDGKPVALLMPLRYSGPSIDVAALRNKPVAPPELP